MPRLLFRILISSVLGFAFPALASNDPCSIKDSFPRITLKSTSGCRAWISNSQGRICLSEELWKKWLSDENSSVFCGELSGEWKFYSPPQNPKEILTIFHLKSLPHKEQHFVPNPWVKLQRHREALSQMLRPHDSWGVLRSLLLGEKDLRAPLSELRLFGFVHLMSASGIHLFATATILSWVLSWIFKLAQLSARTALFITRLLVSTFWIWAWLLTGCRLGMLRPLFLVGARLFAGALGFRWKLGSVFILSLLVHSFSGDAWPARIELALSIAGFIYALELSREAPKRKVIFLSCLGGWLFVALWQGCHHEIISFATPVISLLTTTFFTAVVYPWLILISVFSVKTPDLFYFLFNQGLKVLIQGALQFHSLWYLSPIAVFCSATAALALSLLTFNRSKRTQIICFTLFIFLFGTGRWIRTRIEKPESDVIQLDVGQGDAALVHESFSRGSIGLIDVGSTYALSDTRWIELLSKHGTPYLDWVALTHLDEDHRGGLDHLSRIVRIGCVATSWNELTSPRGIELGKKLIARGIRLESLESGCVPLPTYAVKHFGARSPAKNGNANMSAVLVPLRGGDFYLSPGDAEEKDEIKIAHWADQWIKRNEISHPPQGRRILKISHHGSKTSTEPETLRVFHPDAVVISVGVGNRYGHPNHEVLSRLEKYGAPIYRTDRDGEIRAEDVRRRLRSHLR